MMPISAQKISREHLLRIARQEAMTSLLLGVDVLPRTRQGGAVHIAVDDAIDRAVTSDGRRAVAVEPKLIAREPTSAASATRPSSSSASPNATTPPSPQGADAMARSRTADAAPVNAAPLTPSREGKSDPAGKQAALDALLERYEREFPHEVIDTPHTRIVWGEGHCDADVMFIGEAPGADEDRTGRPFIGRAGQKLTEIIEAMGLGREVVYITNILKVRPPNNRTPLRHEVEATWPFLAEQIRIIQPRAIVTLGGPSTKLILSTDEGITKLRGIWAAYRDPERDFQVPVMPTFHPAFLLRQYTRENRQKVWSDMLAVLEKLDLPRPGGG